MNSCFEWLRGCLQNGRDSDRCSVLIIAAHPDDEVIGASGILRRADDLQIVHTTDGAPANLQDALAAGCSSCKEYSELRRTELISALEIASRADTFLRQLPFKDHSLAFNMPALIDAVRWSIEQAQPEIIVTHPYEGGHPDHDSTALAVRIAILEQAAPPVIVEMTSYHLGHEGLRSSHFLPAETEEFTIELSTKERARKEAMLACFKSQQCTLKYFRADHERFRIAPDYDFTQPPHAGELFYEKFPWGVRGDEWRQLAKAAVSNNPVAWP